MNQSPARVDAGHLARVQVAAFARVGTAAPGCSGRAKLGSPSSRRSEHSRGDASHPTCCSGLDFRDEKRHRIATGRRSQSGRAIPQPWREAFKAIFKRCVLERGRQAFPNSQKLTPHRLAGLQFQQTILETESKQVKTAEHRRGQGQ